MNYDVGAKKSTFGKKSRSCTSRYWLHLSLSENVVPVAWLPKTARRNSKESWFGHPFRNLSTRHIALLRCHKNTKYCGVRICGQQSEPRFVQALRVHKCKRVLWWSVRWGVVECFRVQKTLLCRGGWWNPIRSPWGWRRLGSMTNRLWQLKVWWFALLLWNTHLRKSQMLVLCWSRAAWASSLAKVASRDVQFAL